MDDAGNAQTVRGPDDRGTYIAAFGKDGRRRDLLQCLTGFSHAFDDPAGIGQVLQAEITAQLPGGDAGIRKACTFRQCLFNSLIGTDIMNVISALLQLGDKSQVRRYMAGASAAGKDDCRHKIPFLQGTASSAPAPS